MSQRVLFCQKLFHYIARASVLALLNCTLFCLADFGIEGRKEIINYFISGQEIHTEKGYNNLDGGSRKLFATAVVAIIFSR